MKYALLTRLLLLVSLVAATQLHADDGISAEAKTYLDSALQIMQEHFVYKDRIDWEQLKRDVSVHATGAQTAIETYPAIRFALEKLGDHHSYLQLTPELMRQASSRGVAATAFSSAPARSSANPLNPFPSPFRTRRVPEGAMVAPAARPIAQIVIPMFSGPALSDFATKVQNVIADLAAKNPCGWIVDLRGNGGGNMWPMMAGIGPILGEGEPGGMRAASVTEKWFYEDGKAGMRNDTKDPYYAKTNSAPVKLKSASPVAVLIDRETGSSGEGIAVAFRERPDTRFFGETTYGVATSTFPYNLSDGAQLYLVTGVMVDRKGNEYPNGIKPDQEILSDFSISSHDPVIRAATDWLSAQKTCKTAASGKLSR